MAEHDEVLSARSEILPKGGLDRLFPMIDAAMREAGVEWPAVACIVTGAGPGSFAGVRSGVAAARGFAVPTGRQSIGISGADLTAHAVAAEGAVEGLLAVCFGRPPHFAWRRYHLDQGAVEALGHDFETGDVEMLRRVRPVAVAGPSAEAVLATGMEATVVATPSPKTIVLSMARLARCGQGVSPPTPIYLRPPDAAPPSSRPPVRLEAR